MPGRDGSGPTGQGFMSGRGLGVCSGLGRGSGRSFGAGLFCRRGTGFRRNMNLNPISKQTQQELLAEQKELLQKEIDFIDQQLEGAKD